MLNSQSVIFWTESVSFLGHVVTKDGIQVNPQMIEAVSE